MTNIILLQYVKHMVLHWPAINYGITHKRIYFKFIDRHIIFEL